MNFSFFTRPQFINEILKATAGKTYLEIGVRFGGTFFRVNCKNKIGVDPQSNFAHSMAPLINKLKNEKSKIFLTPSDKFFSENSLWLRKNKIDICFIDGLHSFEQSLKDVQNCLRYLNARGIIIMHDCNPTSHHLSHKPDNVFTLTDYWSGDVWKTIVYLRSKRGNLKLVTLNSDYGIGLIKKGKPDDNLNYSLDEVKKLTYKDLVLNRHKFLNLKDVDDLVDFLK